MIAALGRYFRRPSRVPRALRAGLALVLGAGALTGWAAAASPAAVTDPGVSTGQSPPISPATTSTRTVTVAAAPTKRPDPPGAGNETQRIPTSPTLVNEGSDLYEESCSSCHGMLLQGRKGVAPSLIGVGAGPPLFYLSTGRMPLSAPKDEPERATPAFTRRQIDAIVDFIATFGGAPAPAADPPQGGIATGFQVFTENCAGCHSIVARGGMTVGAQVPNLQSATADQIAEAVRMGPYLMPHFDAKQIDQYELNSLARYVLSTRHPDNAGGWGIGNIGPVPEGIVAWFMGLAALLLVARLIGERA